MAEKIERIYTVPLRNSYNYVRTKRTRRAVRLLREFVCRHMKAEEKDVILSNALNNYLWKRSIQKPPRRVKIRTIKEDGRVKAYLADEKIEEMKQEVKKEEKKPEKKEEPKKAEEKKESKEEPKEAPKDEAGKKKEDELKKEQRQKAEAAMAEKEAKKAIKEEEAKIEIAGKKKFTHGKETR